MNPLCVAVRALCEFTAKAGDLDQRFTPSPTAAQGVEGHQHVQRQRPAGYEAEIPLQGMHGALQVKGRADGYDPAANQLEEIKTYRGKLDGVRAHHRALHWAQAKVYAHLLCVQRELPQVRVALVYFNIDTHKESVLVQTCTAADLAQHFAALCSQYVAWAQLQHQHRLARDAALKALEFPLERFRAGQRELAVAVYRTAAAKQAGQVLMAQAPTGIGKSMGTLFPMLKACAAQQLDKVFFLTAKGTGREAAHHALQAITARLPTQPGAPLRTLTLRAREDSCEHPDKACHGESCPLAQQFYDHLPAARQAMVQQGEWTPQAVRAVALQHRICPYYFTQELAKWADVVVGDYNYFYDSTALLAAMTHSYQWKVGVLVDEAHNLVERARAMYSAPLSQFDLAGATPNATGRIQRALRALNREWKALNAQCPQAYQALPEIPAAWLKALHTAISRIAEVNAEAPLLPGDPVLDFYLKALAFEALAEQLGPHAFVDVTLAASATARKAWSTVHIRNAVPAHYLQPRHALAHATVLFSGTLTPWNFYSDLLGLPPNWYWLDVPTPFVPAQLQVHVKRNLSTKYKDRRASMAQLVDTLAGQFRAAPGNYLCFVSSFEYLDQVADAFAQAHPDITITRQYRGMDEAAKAQFLAQFTPGSQQLGFVVLGGVFSEGVDLPGDRLIGVFIATLGLPQFNPVNDQMRLAMQAVFGAEHGYTYTYLYPGMRKVAQAGGRVIRTEADRGVIYLLDARYGDPAIQSLLPAWWMQACTER